jgi:16S rRNA (cytosine967-C5)-methyltransferase
MTPAPALARSLEAAARLVAKVAAGRSLSDEFARADDAGGRAALLDISHGTLRRYGRSQAIVRELSHKGAADPLVQALLWCALYALESGRYGEHTVVDQAVAACGFLERWNTKGYVNALLRGYLRNRSSIQARLALGGEALYQHPAWWIDLVRRSYPETWEPVLADGNSHPPMCLRVNVRRERAENYAARLSAAGVEARSLGGAALLLEKPVPVERLPGFQEGHVSVQDAGAQRAAACLGAQAGDRVLDACAAPGGKSAHILELADVRLVALDADAGRCARISANLARLGLSPEAVKSADCIRLETWWDGVPFERILADVPCTASGVARRYPDLKWLRRATDVASFAAKQSAILAALWQALAPGGKLLYVTCSVFPGENEDVVKAFIAGAGNALRLPLPDGQPPQWLPSAEHDGFFLALIQKQA